MGRLEGKVAIITGASGGWGAADARLFVQEGAKVVMTDIQEGFGQKTADELGNAAVFVRHDVTSEADWARIVDLAVKRFGRLDILVNNAGGGGGAAIMDMATEDYLRTIAVNLHGVWHGIRAAVPALRAAGGGSIVNISSNAGLFGLPAAGAYSAAKFGVRGLSRTAALELAHEKIRVNSVHAGFIASQTSGNPDEIYKAVYEERRMNNMTVPLGRPGSVDEAAKLVLFLASDDSSYCTGGEFVIDGGMNAGPLPVESGYYGPGLKKD